ncbi:MAG: hypothetical protein JNL98_24185 [Bryobacterales bacterium]|nr:hypothetical protein [Bryobacterales bacterium]
MSNNLRESGHLIRLAAVLAVAVVGFLVLRAAVIPPEFGKYGHYRPGALEDNQKRAIQYAGQADCLSCHEEQAKQRSAGKHAKVSCEACHGPLAKHTEDPQANKPQLPQGATLCASCHEKDAAKPKWFPQVVTAEHNTGMACNSCHQAHQPKL